MDHAGFTLVVTSRSNFSFVLWELKAFSTLWMSKFFTGELHNERSSLNYAEEKITCTVKRLTVRTLKPGDLKEDCPISTFSENKRFSSFFCKRPITFINWTCRFPRGQVSSNGFKFLSVAKWNTSILLVRFQKNSESFVLRKRCGWKIFFQVSRFECPHCKACKNIQVKGLASFWWATLRLFSLREGQGEKKSQLWKYRIPDQFSENGNFKNPCLPLPHFSLFIRQKA